MDPATQSWTLIFGWIAIGMLCLMGIGLLFAQPTNIERPSLVGGLTLAGALVAAYLLSAAWQAGGPFGWWHVVGIVFAGLAFHGWARLADYLMGGRPVDPERDEKTLGAPLSD